MTLGLIDLISYLGLAVLLFFMTRVRSLERIRIRIDGAEVSGVILNCKFSLSTRVGLLNTPALAMGDGILLIGASSIHTMGMHFPIDLIFIDERKRVVGWQCQVPPGHHKIKGPFVTKYILELGPGTINRDLPNIKLNAQAEVEPWIQA